MVVVTSLGPPEEGIRHTQEAVATFVNRSVGPGDWAGCEKEDLVYRCRSQP